MFEELARLISGLCATGDDILRLHRLIELAQAKEAELLADFDRDRMWEVEGSGSLSVWLRRELRMSGGTAALTANRARVVAHLPATGTAWQAGEFSTGQVDAIAAVATPARVDAMAEVETAIVPKLVGLSVRDTTTCTRSWAAKLDALTDRGETREEPPSTLFLSSTFDGRVKPQGASRPMTAPSCSRPFGWR